MRALPWCNRTWVKQMQWGNGESHPYTQSEPNLLAYALVAAFSIFVIAWGVRQFSRALVNLGIVGFAIAVVWFYFSNIFDKVGRSLGLIGNGHALSRRRVGPRKDAATAARHGTTEAARRPGHEDCRDIVVGSVAGVLVIQLAIVSSIAAKYLYQRWHCPRVWTRTAAYDPELADARALSEHAAHRGRMPEHAALGQTGAVPAQLDGVPNGRDFSVAAGQVHFPAKLAVRNNKLVAIRIPDTEDSARGQSVFAQRRRSLRSDAPQ